ncbi:hypothetical protein [Corynebacterium liangguodongii]|uniref:Uncharacterized protein n=1 Tax=Corynebacterium liangguodongii TaxID=2079535 RepID=A0A2S0WCX4_9CORY|nr:hypothetical protein [Corynebacterium liangguodongii]AWB83618.1 hypothetical protein C3E79_03230 [Corynebacterium liangguodongii]PWB99574.1 hypothetical protein DF219_06565 [Corynebacterium liangguodongii]
MSEPIVLTFLVADGMVVDAPAYAAALRRAGVPSSEINRLRIQLATLTGTRRVILEVSGGVSLSLRPLPPAPSEITVEAHPIRDERTAPQHFGPDLGWQRGALARLRAHEGLLIDASSRIPQAICAPLLTVSAGIARVSTHPATTPSIALDGVVEILSELGAVIEEVPGFQLRELLSTETWVVDPIYGARVVSHWREYGAILPGRTLLERGGMPTHRDVNELRRERAVLISR